MHRDMLGGNCPSLSRKFSRIRYVLNFVIPVTAGLVVLLCCNFLAVATFFIVIVVTIKWCILSLVIVGLKSGSETYY